MKDSSAWQEWLKMQIYFISDNGLHLLGFYGYPVNK
jgi:hypothetical protein